MSQPHTTLTDAFWAYERALMTNDLAELDRLFAPGPGTLRGDADGLLVGHDQISAFGGGRAVPAEGRPWRRIVQTHIQAIDPDHALVVAVTELTSGGRGQQTQMWGRFEDGWKVTAAHVSVPAPALDTRIWRVVGDPLLPGHPGGPLSGESVAVKDVYAVAGHRIGAGNPAWLEHASPESTHAWAVQRLLDHGADLRGISQCDEFAYALAGTNAHYGTPPNPSATFRVSGGSSSGSASAVSLGHASIGLGTDTSGSIRVPAAYQGLFGIRTSHGAVPLDGTLGLAPRFDTVGWVTRDAALLAAVGEALLPPTPAHRAAADARLTPLVVVPQLLALADPEVATAITAWLDIVSAAGTTTIPEPWDADVRGWSTTYTTVAAHQAWDLHGEWLTARLDSLGPLARARFEAARDLSSSAAETAVAEADRAREAIRGFVGERFVVLPAASSVAPRPGDDLSATREATIGVTSLAGLGGLPAITIPLTTSGGLPCGVSVIGAAGRDKDLLTLAQQLSGWPA